MGSLVPADDRFADSGAMEFIDMQYEDRPEHGNQTDIEAAHILSAPSPDYHPARDIEMSIMGEPVEVFDLIHEQDNKEKHEDDTVEYKEVELTDESHTHSKPHGIRQHLADLQAKWKALPVKARISVGIFAAVIILFGFGLLVALATSEVLINHDGSNQSGGFYITVQNGGVAGDCKIVSEI